MKNNFTIGIFISLLLLLSCSSVNNTDTFSIDDSTLKTIGWKCHETIVISKDDEGDDCFLITAHSPKVTYPSIYVPWFQGDISDLDSLIIVFNNPESERNFHLFLWDGDYPLEYSNRYNFQIEYKSGSRDTLAVPLKNGLKTNSGRFLDLENIELAVFYTTNNNPPFSFPLYDIYTVPRKG